MLRLTEQQLHTLIKESVAQCLTEMTSENSEINIQRAMDACINIIIKTECAGRAFDFRGHAQELEIGPKYSELKKSLSHQWKVTSTQQNNFYHTFAIFQQVIIINKKE